MLQKHILEVKKQNVANHLETEELKQYGKRHCLRFQGFPVEKHETSDKKLSKVKDMCKEAGVNISDTVFDTVRGIGNTNVDNKSKKKEYYSAFYNFSSQNYGLSRQ